MSTSLAKKKAWKAFSLYIRLRDSLKTTGDIEECECFTCGKRCPTTGRGCIQAGHMVSGRTNAVLFDEEIVRGQCYGCNVGQYGKYAEFTAKMVREKGIDWVEDKIRLKSQTIQYTEQDYNEIRAKYQAKVGAIMEREKGLV